MERTPIWAAGAQDWWDFTRSGRAKRGVGEMPAETRASDGWVENEAGLLVKRSPNTRSMAGKGLLTYPTRTNLLTYSEQFNNAAWAQSNSTKAANVAVSPDGTTTADRIVATTASGYVFQAPSLTAGTAYTVSAFMKKDTLDIVGLCFAAAAFPSGGNFAWFDLQNGTISSVESTITATITALPGGWYRCTATKTAGATAAANIRLQAGAGWVTGSADAWFAWGAQLEVGAFATPYIPNATGSPLTANGPLQVLNLSGKLNTGFGFVFRCNVLQPASGSVRLIEFYQSNHAVNIYNAGGTLKFDVYASGVQTTSLSLGSWAQGRNTFAAAVMNGYAMARRVGNSAPVAGSGAYSACANAGLLGAGAYDGNNTYGLSEQFAAWYGPMSAHFFDNVLWPKAQLLAQVA